jgi:peptidoglycan/xylan/chitin deacetylase (PgdA/CDA1 family)
MDIARGVLRALKDDRVPQAYGFANGLDLATQPALIDVFKEWLEAGYPLGNHTFHHGDLNALTAQEYIADIEQMDRWLEAGLQLSPFRHQRRVFRYPYLNEGETREKRQAIRSYLFTNGYKIAPVTIDVDDWAWNDAYTRCLAQHDTRAIARLRLGVVEAVARSVGMSRAAARRLLGRDIAHVLLVHMNALNAVMLHPILADLRARHVTFVSLDEALEDSVYEIDPTPPYRAGLTFLKQLAAARHVDIDSLRERAGIHGPWCD